MVELGERTPVEGAPLARVASRLTWPHEKETVRRKEGETDIRTPDGPRTLNDVLDEVGDTYFDTRQSFLKAVRAEIGTGPVATADE